MANLKIYDDIGREEVVLFFGGKQSMFSAEKMRDFIDNIPADDNTIDTHLHCRGGSVIEGYTISDLLRMSGKTINMTVDGLCASIATVILLAAPKENRKIYPNARLLIHRPYIPEFTLADSYESEDLQKMADDLKAEETKLLDYYVDRTGADREELREMMEAETELSAQEALRLGFVNEILKPVSNSYNKFNNKLHNFMDEKNKQEFEAKLKNTDTVLNKLLKVLGLNSAGDKVAMDVTTATGETISIERESGDPQVGDKATPDGVFTMPDGSIITVEGGEITTIEPPADMEALKAENEALKAEIEGLKAANQEMNNVVAEAKQAGENAKALYDELKQIQSKYVPAQRSQNFQEPSNSIEDRLKARIQEAKTKTNKK